MFSEYILDGVPPLLFWTFVGLAIVIQGISKSGFAGGVGILSLPLMMLVMPVDKVAATLLPLLILCDFNAVYHHRHNKVWPHVRELYVPCIGGILAGALVWWWVGREGIETYGPLIKRFVGIIAIVFAFYIIGRERAMAWVSHVKPGRIAGMLTGLAAGFCSTIAHAGGPIVSLYLFSHGMGKTLYVGTTAWTFLLINATKLPFYLVIGLIGPREIAFALLLIWLVPIGSWLGRWLHDRVSEELFNRVIMVFVLLGGIQLLAGTNFFLAALRYMMPR